MSSSVLGSITLGYRPFWNRSRALAGLQLFVHEDRQRVDGKHLLRTLEETWSASAPLLMLSVQTPTLLTELVTHAERDGPLLEVPLDWLSSGLLRTAVSVARKRGVRMIGSSAPGRLLDAESQGWFERRMTMLSAADAATAMQAVLRAKQDAVPGRVSMKGRIDGSPLQPDTLVEGVASRALAEHALDQQGAWAVAGWPIEDVLHGQAGEPMPPTRRGIVQVMNAIDDEQSLERIEQLVGQEPTLTYALLLYLNSPGLGLRSGVSSLRQGFMMIGYQKLSAWLSQQMPTASEDANLRPVNQSMVLRSHLMERIMDAGVEDDLRREIYLCGLFSQLDLVMNEPLRASFARIPLADRIVAATASLSGPYAPALQLATALESPHPASLRALRIKHDVDAEEINRALLRTLAAIGS